ncbi:DNL zinc finger-domain-containing protein [Xylaria sp. FL0043]|nr:DNL zinc finger-domain-containing protein [Xylaria sp. FL0043]
MASRIAPRYLTTILRAPRTVSPSLLRPYPRLPRTLQPTAHRRFAHTIPKPSVPAQEGASSSSSPDAPAPRKQLEPHYRLTFTCVPCTARSSHVVSKQGYHRGSVLITCPSCRNRHIISDHLNIFGDRRITVEDLLREKGQLVKRGTLGEEGDIEFWEDDPPSAGEADAAPLADEGGQDEARRLRETRDPSSRATDPTPSTSVLPGDTGTRPSVQGASHQNTTPSTRRQYHTVRPPPGVERGKSLLDRTKLSSGSKVNSSGSPYETLKSYDSPERDDLADLTNLDMASLRMALHQEGDDIVSQEILGSTPRHAGRSRSLGTWRSLEGWRQPEAERRDQSEIQHKDQPEIQHNNQWEAGHKHQLKIRYQGSNIPSWVRKMRERQQKNNTLEERLARINKWKSNRETASGLPPMARRVQGEVRFTGVRLVGTESGQKVAVQLKPGIALKRRPPGGVFVERPKRPIPSRELIPDSVSSQPGSSRHEWLRAPPSRR